jgi:putative flippase GtrA
MLEPQFIRFLLAGCGNTAFGLAVYSAAVHLGLAPWAALLTGMLAGVAFNFVTLGGYAFRDLSLPRLPRFVCSYGATYLVNLGALHLLRSFIADAIVCQCILTPPMAVFSYLCLSRFVFRRSAPE